MPNQRENRGKIIAGILGFLWFVAIILSYFVNHKPFSEATAASLALAVWKIAVCLLILSLAGGLGRFLLQRVKWQPQLHPLAHNLLSAALGLGTISLAIFIPGALFRLPPRLLWLPILLVPAILLRHSIRSWWNSFSSLKNIWKNSSPAGKGVALLLLGLMASSLVVALTPPRAFDSLVSHLVMPQAYLAQNRISYLPWLFMSGMPQIFEVLTLPVIALSNAGAAALLGWGISILALLGLLGFLHQHFDSTSAWVGIAALFSGYSLVTATASAYVEWPGLLFAAAALICLDIWLHENHNHSIILAGIFTGFTLGTKYTTAVVAVALAAALTFQCWNKRRNLLANLLRLALPALIVFLPWLLKNFFTTGNPLYPLLFPSGAMTALRLEGYQALPPWGNWQDILLLPFRATYLGVDKAAGYGIDIGPLFLALGAVSWFSAKPRTQHQSDTIRLASIIALTGIVLWVIANQNSGFLLQTRYYYTLFPAFAVLAVAGYFGFSTLILPAVRFERLVNTLVILVLALNLLHVSSVVLESKAPQTLLGIESEETYLTHTLGWYYPVMQHIQQMPSDQQVLLFFEPRSLYCAGRCRPDEIMDRWKRDWTTYQDIDLIKAAWREEGFTHILYYQTGANFMRSTGAVQYSENDWQALDKFLAAFPPPINFDEVYLLYSLE